MSALSLLFINSHPPCALPVHRLDCISVCLFDCICLPVGLKLQGRGGVCSARIAQGRAPEFCLKTRAGFVEEPVLQLSLRGDTGIIHVHAGDGGDKGVPGQGNSTGKGKGSRKPQAVGVGSAGGGRRSGPERLPTSLAPYSAAP